MHYLVGWGGENVVFSLDANSDSGSDGFIGLYFQKSWTVFGAYSIKVIQYLFQVGFISPGVNFIFMVLIPKSTKVQLSNFAQLC